VSQTGEATTPKHVLSRLAARSSYLFRRHVLLLLIYFKSWNVERTKRTWQSRFQQLYTPCWTRIPFSDKLDKATDTKISPLQLRLFCKGMAVIGVGLTSLLIVGSSKIHHVTATTMFLASLSPDPFVQSIHNK
jgi:hypothetical protein